MPRRSLEQLSIYIYMYIRFHSYFLSLIFSPSVVNFYIKRYNSARGCAFGRVTHARVTGVCQRALCRRAHVALGFRRQATETKRPRQRRVSALILIVPARN